MNPELKKLEQIRKKCGYSLQFMAQKLEISKTYYYLIEKGKRRLSYDLARTISNILKCSTDELFMETFNVALGLGKDCDYVNEIENC